MSNETVFICIGFGEPVRFFNNCCGIYFPCSSHLRWKSLALTHMHTCTLHRHTHSRSRKITLFSIKSIWSFCTIYSVGMVFCWFFEAASMFHACSDRMKHFLPPLFMNEAHTIDTSFCLNSWKPKCIATKNTQTILYRTKHFKSFP